MRAYLANSGRGGSTSFLLAQIPAFVAHGNLASVKALKPWAQIGHIVAHLSSTGTYT
jgi:hypothetical protein